MKKKVVKKKLKKIWIIIFTLIFVCMLSVSSYKIIKYYLDYKKTNDIINEILNETIIIESNNTPIEEASSESSSSENDLYYDFINTPFASVDFTNLMLKNNETVAWLIVNNTNINYPVVQTTNNEFYLNHSFDKTYNGGGWLFMDYRNNANTFDTNTIIYGHSLLSKTMFGTLLNARYSWWYTNKDNQVIKLSTPVENTIWQIFSIYKISPESYYITNTFNNENEINNFFNTLKSRSVYDFNVELNENDKILTLSTCNTSDGNERLVVHAKLIKKEVR